MDSTESLHLVITSGDEITHEIDVDITFDQDGVVTLKIGDHDLGKIVAESFMKILEA
jgi:hypothetical protein